MLIEIPLGKSLTEYEMIIGTSQEEFELELSRNDIEREFNESQIELMQYNFKDKYLKAIDYIGTIHITKNNNGKYNLFSTINDFHLFYTLYRNTFNKIEDKS